MEENAPATPKMLAEIFGGFLTWLGAAVGVLALAWWAITALHWTTSNWRIASVLGIAGSVAYAIAGFIERKRRA